MSTLKRAGRHKDIDDIDPTTWAMLITETDSTQTYAISPKFIPPADDQATYAWRDDDGYRILTRTITKESK